MKTTRILHYLLYFTVISVIWVNNADLTSQADPIFLARWSSETANIIGLTDGASADIYDSDFSLIQSFTLPTILSASQISFQASVWSPDLNYVHRVVLYDDTYTGPSPYKTLLQVWRIDTQQLVFEHLGPITSGITWNQQSTQFAFAVQTGLGSSNLLLFDTAGNQITELIPPISGSITRIAWNFDGSRIAFNSTSNLYVWDFASDQYLTSPTDSFIYDAPLHFSAISNQLAYVKSIDDLDAEAITIWDMDTSQEVGQLLGHQGIIYTFDWKSNRIASVGLDDTIRIWNSQTFQQIAEYDRGFITQVQLSPDANTLLTNGPDASTFQTIDPLTGQVLSTNYTQLVREFGLVNGDNQQLISLLNNEDTLDLASLPTQNLIISADTNPSAVGSVVFDLNGTIQTDDTAPYELTNWMPTPGQYILTATPYTEAGGTGTAGIPLTLNFTIGDSSTACSSTIPPADTTALIAAITSANGAGTPQTLCLSNSTYTLNTAPGITSDITIVGNDATIVFEAGSGFEMAGDGTLRLEHVTVIRSDDGGG